VRFAVGVGACWIYRATFTVGVTFVGADAGVALVSTLIRATVVRFAVVRSTGKRWDLFTRVVYAAGIFARTVGVNKALGARFGTVGFTGLACNVAF
jgi:hypothetical protein